MIKFLSKGWRYRELVANRDQSRSETLPKKEKNKIKSLKVGEMARDNKWKGIFKRRDGKEQQYYDGDKQGCLRHIKEKNLEQKNK